MQSIGMFLLTVLSTLIGSSNAWFYWDYSTARAKGKPVDPKCVELAQSGSCEFYRCFEQRLTCGRNWYNIKYGLPYCKDFRAYQQTFSPKGQEFINSTLQCMGQEMVSWYQRGAVNCHDYTHAAFKALSRCYIRHGFCEVVDTDASNLVSVYRPEHLFQSGALKIWRELFRIAYKCEPTYFHHAATLLITALKNFKK